MSYTLRDYSSNVDRAVDVVKNEVKKLSTSASALQSMVNSFQVSKDVEMDVMCNFQPVSSAPYQALPIALISNIYSMIVKKYFLFFRNNLLELLNVLDVIIGIRIFVNTRTVNK